MVTSPENSAPAGGQPADHTERTPRAAAKRQAILAAATTVFLREGYHGASMDEITALAGVSKPTVYRNYTDKGELFGAVVRAMMERVDRSFQAENLLPDTSDTGDTGDGTVDDTGDPYPPLRDLARRILTGLLQPDVLRLRRLVVGESERFPEIGNAYWELGFQKGLATVAEGLRNLARRGRLSIADPHTAAGHFAGLVLWIPLNQALLCGGQAVDPADIERHVDTGVRAFLASASEGAIVTP